MGLLDANEGDAPLWQILASIQRKLVDMRFVSQGDDTVFEMDPEAIDVVKTSSMQDGKTYLTPGILVTLPNQSSAPWEGGTCSDMEATFPVLLQIIDGDSQDKIQGMRSYLKWQDMICRVLSQPDLQLVDYATTGVTFEISQCTHVFHLDEKMWRKDQLFKCGVVVECMIRETWGED